MQDNSHNKIIYLFSSLFIYISLYILISLLLKDFYRPYIGIAAFISAILIDLYLYNKKIRIYIRLISIILIYLIIRFLLDILTNIASDKDTYNIFDKTPYIFFRDSFVSMIFIIFYFIFDSLKLKQNRYSYYFSTLVLIVSFFLCLQNLNFDSNINKTIFKNYFNYSSFLIFIILMFTIRHITFNLAIHNKMFKRKDLFLLLLLFFPIIFLLFSIVLQKHINESNKSNSALFNQSLFQFDFSNYVELKDEIKLSEDKVLILELSGVTAKARSLINDGWDKQIYLKRFSLEEYKNGTFKVSENYIDPMSPPVYLSGYEWELKNPPQYKNRINILETLYLINIDSTSLMGSDLLTKVTPVTGWESSSFKQIYKSFCYTTNITYKELITEDLTSDLFIKNLNRERKKILLDYTDPVIDKKIKDLAVQITGQFQDPFYKTLAIQEYFWNNYYYSLRPGMSKNGNQLDHFLFETKKGYCSYFAFAMTLMLRSVGIPARVAVGFAPDMKNSTLNFYEIRGMDGHAWVEVFFDNYGWITFDPTSSNIAEGEEYEFMMGNKEERDKYIEEILKNKDKMQDIKEKKKSDTNLDDIKLRLKNSIKWIGVIGFIIFFITIFLILFIKKKINLFLFYLSNNVRKKTIFLYKHFMGRMLDLGFPIKNRESILEYSQRIKEIADIEKLTELYQMAILREKNEMAVNCNELILIKDEINSQLKRQKLSKKIAAFFDFERLWKKILPLFFLLLCINDFSYAKEEFKYNYNSINEYLEKARESISDSFFDEALSLLNEAEKKFPDSYQPNLRKADLYNDHELYENALAEQLKAKKKGFSSEQFYEDIATSYGRIGDDRNALTIYEEAYNKFYKSKNIYDNLGWMYFKVHNTKKGIEIVNEGIKKYPYSSDLLMTLGTLYSDIWNYEKSKKYYLDSINYSYDDFKSSSFRAISYYNIAILEHSFLYYENAFNSSNASLSLKDRSSAHMELSYLYQSSLELKKAYDESIKATSLEPKTLFPEMSIANIYIYSGNIDKGIKLINDLLVSKDFSWMLYFGTNRDAFYSELYKDLAFAYLSKANQIEFIEEKNPINSLTLPFRKIYYNTLAFFYNFRFANLNIKIGEELIKGGSELEGLHQLYDAYKVVFSLQAYKILLITEEIETKLNPQKQKIFNMEKPVLRKKTDFFYSNNSKIKDLKKSIAALDDRWEKALKVEGLFEIYNSSNRKDKIKIKEEMFPLFPPIFPINNITSEFNITFDKSSFTENIQKKIISSLKNRGIIHNRESRFNLDIKKDDNYYYINIYDNKTIIKSYNIKTDKKNKNNYELITIEIFKKIFIIDL